MKAKSKSTSKSTKNTKKNRSESARKGWNTRRDNLLKKEAMYDAAFEAGYDYIPFEILAEFEDEN